MQISRIDAVLERYLGAPKRELVPMPPPPVIGPNIDALLNVMLALLDLPSDEKLDMQVYGRSPHEPTCVLAHYACRTDLQDVYSGLMQIPNPAFGPGVFPRWRATGTPDGHMYPRTKEYFRLRCSQLEQLFGPFGCLGATAPIEAANYMHRFIKELV